MDSPSSDEADDSRREKKVKEPAPRQTAAVANLKKILVVEDERITQTVISLMLKGVGYTVFPAKDAATALKIIRTEQPDLMTLDIDLSRESAGEAWDGFKIIEWLQHYRPDQPVPFIIVSGGNPAVVRKRAQSLRAYGYLPKPIDKHKLLELVCKAIGKAPAPPPLVTPPVPPKPSPPPIPPAK